MNPNFGPQPILRLRHEIIKTFCAFWNPKFLRPKLPCRTPPFFCLVFFSCLFLVKKQAKMGVIGYLWCTQITPFTRAILSGHSNLYPACLVLILVCSLVTKGPLPCVFVLEPFPFLLKKCKQWKEGRPCRPYRAGKFFQNHLQKIKSASRPTPLVKFFFASWKL